MAVIKNFDKQTLSTMRNELNALLKPFGDDHGITFNLGGIRFNAGSFGVKLEASIKNHTQSTNKSDALPFFMKLLGLQYDGVGGRKLIGYNERAKAYPFQYTQGGKNYKCSDEQAKSYFLIK